MHALDVSNDAFQIFDFGVEHVDEIVAVAFCESIFRQLGDGVACIANLWRK
jgi:hypothetical protein